MINIIRADVFRLRKSRMFHIALVISTISAIGIAVILRLAATGKISQDATVNFSLLVDSFLLYFLGGIVIGKHISNDYESKAIHDEIASGNGRIAIVLAKLISCSMIVVVLTLPYALTTIIGFCLNIKFAAYQGIPSVFYTILSNQAGLSVTGSNILSCIALCAVMIVVYIARISLCIPFAFKTKKVIPVTVIGIACSFIFDLIYGLGHGVKGIADTIETLPYGVAYNLSLESSKAAYGKALLVSVVFLAIVLNATYRLFKKQEIK